MMQRPQSVNSKQVPTASISSSPPGTATGWYPTNSVDFMRSNGLMPHIPSTRSPSPNNLSSNQMFHQFHYQQPQYFVPSSGPGDSSGSNKGSTGSSGATSPVDWSTSGSMAQMDYTSIDWSLNRGFTIPRAWRIVVRTKFKEQCSSRMFLPDGGVANSGTSTSGSHEWSSPFEGDDIFGLSRQFVSSPSL
ncbi:hypothetical protein OIU77_017202 [Salix suchowensis]|uniref:Uncharacterized protein n=1 Tax=Salix suchowensis TaxID=1278906 RepID=A0ABQ8ZN26_9ROSI|nr:hypothetical protein OIU77_017202 [Salix suchowensis]